MGIVADIKIRPPENCPLYSIQNDEKINIINHNNIKGAKVLDVFSPEVIDDDQFGQICKLDDGHLYQVIKTEQNNCLCEYINGPGQVANSTIIKNGTIYTTLFFAGRESFSDTIKDLKRLSRGVFTRSIKDVSNIKYDREPNVRSEILTNRQEEVLRYAYKHGYYSFPREISLTALAEALNIHHSTAQQHLVRSEEKIIKELFLSNQYL